MTYCEDPDLAYERQLEQDLQEFEWEMYKKGFIRDGRRWKRDPEIIIDLESEEEDEFNERTA